MDPMHSKTPEAPKIYKFDSCNNDFQKFLLDFLEILPKKSLNSGRNRQSFRLQQSK